VHSARESRYSTSSRHVSRESGDAKGLGEPTSERLKQLRNVLIEFDGAAARLTSWPIGLMQVQSADFLGLNRNEQFPLLHGRLRLGVRLGYGMQQI